MHVRLLHLALFSTLLALTVPLGSSSAHAQNLVDRRPRKEQRIDPVGISLDEAVSRAESRYRAKAVRVERLNEGERLTYQIRLLNAEGKVWTVRVDAATGRMN